MSIDFNCPTCGQQYHVIDRLAGKKARCKKCGNAILVPKQEQTADAATTRVAVVPTGSLESACPNCKKRIVLDLQGMEPSGKLLIRCDQCGVEKRLSAFQKELGRQVRQEQKEQERRLKEATPDTAIESQQTDETSTDATTGPSKKCIYPKCDKPIPKDAKKCPYCGKPQPSMVGLYIAKTKMNRNFVLGVVALIVAALLCTFLLVSRAGNNEREVQPENELVENEIVQDEIELVPNGGDLFYTGADSLAYAATAGYYIDGSFKIFLSIRNDGIRPREVRFSSLLIMGEDGIFEPETEAKVSSGYTYEPIYSSVTLNPKVHKDLSLTYIVSREGSFVFPVPGTRQFIILDRN